MIRSVFIDYTGTIIQEKGEDLEILLQFTRQLD